MIETQSLNAKIQELSDVTNRLVGERAALLRKQAEKMDELKSLKDGQVELQKTKVVLDDLIKKFIGFQLDKIQEYVTWGLNTVIDDQNLKFDCNVITKNNKPWVELNTKNDRGISENAMDAFGGSVAQIESLVLRVLAILQLKLYPLLVMDESLNAVSTQYLNNTSKLLNELSKQLGIKILLVTHNTEILAHANKVYRANETKNGLKFDVVGATDLT
jgi:hypothetical protein